MSGWKVTYYISLTGENPVKKFLDMRPAAKLKAFRIFSHIEEFGLTSVISHVKKLVGTPLWEIRILGGDSVRIFYVTQKEKKILILHAFAKKTNKTPIKEIEIALSRIPN